LRLEVLDLATHTLGPPCLRPGIRDAAAGAGGTVGAGPAEPLRVRVREPVVALAQARRDMPDGPFGLAEEAGTLVDISVGVDTVAVLRVEGTRTDDRDVCGIEAGEPRLVGERHHVLRRRAAPVARARARVRRGAEALDCRTELHARPLLEARILQLLDQGD